MSAIGSVMLICYSSPLRLPAGLDHARDLATHGDLAQLVARQAELAIHAAGPPGQRATVAQTHWTRVARQLLQLGTRLVSLLVRELGVADDCCELRALRGELLHGLA